MTRLPGDPGVGKLVRIAVVVPLLLLFAAVAGLTLYCRWLLAATPRASLAGLGDLQLLVAAGGFLVTAVAVVLVQAVRVAARVAGPEHRLRLALQRIRSGDLAFEVRLRQGDLLQPLAEECNELLAWLRQQPPAAVGTGAELAKTAPELCSAGEVRG